MNDNLRRKVTNVSEVPWQQFPGHFGSALSKALVDQKTHGAKHIDYRISMYQPMAHVEMHTHSIQEQVYHVLEGEALVSVGGESRVVKKHDVVFVPPGIPHSVNNTGLSDLIFIVVTSPVSDEEVI